MLYHDHSPRPLRSRVRSLPLAGVLLTALLTLPAASQEELPHSVYDGTLHSDLKEFIKRARDRLDELDSVMEKPDPDAVGDGGWGEVIEAQMKDMEELEEELETIPEEHVMHDWWRKTRQSWDWLRDGGGKAATKNWSLSAIESQSEETLPQVKLVLERIHTEAGRFEENLDRLNDVVDKQRKGKGRLALEQVSMDLIFAPALEELIRKQTSSNETFQEEYDPEPFGDYSSWFAEWPNPGERFGKHREKWERAGKENFEAANDAYQDVVEQLAPLMGNGLFKDSKKYDRMRGWAHDEIAKNLQREHDKLLPAATRLDI